MRKGAAPLLFPILVGTILGLFIVIVAVDPVRPEAQGVVHLEQPADGRASPSPGGRPLRVAVAAMVSPGDTFLSYRRFADYLAAQLGMKAELVLRPTYEEVNELVRRGEVDVAFICSGAYAAAVAEGGVHLLAAPVVAGETTYNSDIIVARTSTARGLVDLRGRRFGYVDQLSNSGWLAPRRRLAELGYDPDRFFGDVIITHSHDKSIRAVAQGIADGASVDSLILEAMLSRGDPEAGAVKVVERLGPFGMPPVVTPEALDPELEERLLQALLAMGDTPESRAILAPLRIDRFRVPSPTEYQDLVEAAAAAE
ncbi:MAG: phosphate/phosphite/phosphonate ABC transporter substrate-binding protein [Thermoleophilia bacterium]